jgi:hypothetical protein
MKIIFVGLRNDTLIDHILSMPNSKDILCASVHASFFCLQNIWRHACTTCDVK